MPFGRLSARPAERISLARSATLSSLEDYLATHPHRHDPTAPLWPGRQPGTKGHPAGLDYDRPFDIASLKRYYFKPVLKRLRLEDFSWHDLRHFYATTLVHSRRYSDKQVQERMGHASYAFTLDRYGHAPEEEIVSMPFDDMYGSRGDVTPLEPHRAV